MNTMLLGFLTVLIVFSLELILRFYWKKKWEAREIFGAKTDYFNTIFRILFSSSSGLAILYVFNNVPMAISISASVWLSLISISTDIVSKKIPKEACWTVFGINLLSLLYIFSPPSLASAFVAFIIVGLALILTAILSKGGLGSGDLRLLLALSLLAGWFGFTAILAGLIIGSLIQIPVRIIIKKKNQDALTFPFGPALIVGILLGICFLGSLNGPAYEWAGIL